MQPYKVLLHGKCNVSVCTQLHVVVKMSRHSRLMIIEMVKAMLLATIDRQKYPTVYIVIYKFFIYSLHNTVIQFR